MKAIRTLTKIVKIECLRTLEINQRLTTQGVFFFFLRQMVESRKYSEFRGVLSLPILTVSPQLHVALKPVALDPQELQNPGP